jgi:hypothetical protein
MRLDALRALLLQHIGRSYRQCDPAFHALLTQTLARHPRWDPASVAGLRVQRARLNGSVQLQARRTGPGRQRWTTVSWRACADNPPAVAVRAVPTLAAALRSAIWRQTASWRRRMEQKCAECSATSVPFEVDHIDPPFRSIVAAFVVAETAAGRPPADPPNCRYSRRSCAPVLTDRALKRRWQLFHRGRARYQLLCRGCNRRKQ